MRAKLGSYFVTGPFAILLAFPFYWMLWTAFKTDQDLYNVENVPFSFSQGSPTTRNFSFLWENTQYPTWLKNTLVVGAGVVLITLVLSLPAGYALARLSGRWGHSVGVGIFLTYLVPPALLFLPLVRLITDFGLGDSKWSLVLVYPTFTIPFCTWLLHGYFKTVPREIEEAARVDGCGRFGAVWRVILPVSMPGILSVVIFAATLSIQEFLYALTFVSAADQKPVPLGVATDLVRGDIFYWGSLMSGALIIGIPVAILYNFFLDHFVVGITGGATK